MFNIKSYINKKNIRVRDYHIRHGVITNGVGLFIRPILTYAFPVYYTSTKHNFYTLQVMQNKFLRIAIKHFYPKPHGYTKNPTYLLSKITTNFYNYCLKIFVTISKPPVAQKIPAIVDVGFCMGRYSHNKLFTPSSRLFQIRG